MYFMEGYIFIKHTPDIQFFKLQDTTYFSSVLCRTAIVNGRRQQQYSLLSDDDLSIMRDGMQDLKIAAFSINDPVRITKGSYKNLTGEVVLVYEGGQHVQVAVNHLRSKKLLMDYPVTYLAKV
jgi:transcription antitermination factor NusG